MMYLDKSINKGYLGIYKSGGKGQPLVTVSNYQLLGFPNVC